uniref:Extracellular domainscontaining protein CG31004like [Hydra vulgaris] n=1 Tax=Lepeophtheirus salmonis TaxID=72036 RepID=A0A0K2T4U7_LEPSM
MNMIDWYKIVISVPPILQYWSDKELMKAKNEPLKIKKYPCHSQSVEMAVKLVSEVSCKVYGYNQRHGYILSTLKSRDKLRKFKTKCKYPV